MREVVNGSIIREFVVFARVSLEQLDFSTAVNTTDTKPIISEKYKFYSITN